MARRGVVRDCEGAAAMEFAFTAVIFFTLIFAMVEYVLISIGQNVIENAAMDASRAGITGYAPGGSRENYLREIILQNAALLNRPENLTITSLVYPGLAQVGQPEPFVDADGNGVYTTGEAFTDVNGNGRWDGDMGAPGLGGADEIVLYTINYRWDVITPFMDRFFGGEDGAVFLSAVVLVKNEPFEGH